LNQSVLTQPVVRHLAELFPLAWPVIVSRAGIMLMVVVDTIMVGRYSAIELGYLGIGAGTVSLLVVSGLGLILGTQVLAASAFGSGAWRECGAIWRRSLPYALGLGAIGTALCLLGEPLLHLTGQSADIAKHGGRVIAIFGLGLPAYLLWITTTFFLEAIKKPKPGMIPIIIANLANVPLNGLLVYGKAGFPELGAEGSAWATTTVRLLLGLGLALYAWHMADGEKFGVRHQPTGGWRAGARQRAIGYAAGASLASELLAFSILTQFAGWLGPLDLAGYSIVINLIGLPFMIAVGLGSATAIQVSIAASRHDRRDVALAGWTGLGVNCAAMLATGLLFWATRHDFAALFTTDPAVIALAAALIALAPLMLLFDGGQTVLANALRGLGETWAPFMIVTLSYMVIMLPASWLLAFPLGGGARGLIGGLIVGAIIAIILLSFRFHRLTRRK